MAEQRVDVCGGRSQERLETVRSLWIGDELPAAQAACLASHVRVGHPFELFTYGPVRGVPAGVRVRDASEIVARERVFRYGEAAGAGKGGLSGFSNLFRYALLVREGGWWVDADAFCLRALPEMEVLVSSERTKEGGVHANGGALRCPAGHALARYCYERAEAADTSVLIHGQTGPLLIAEAVVALRLEAAVVAPEMFCPVPWFRYEELARPGVLPAEACGVHLWGEMWRQKCGAIPWPGAEGSLMAGLARTP